MPYITAEDRTKFIWIEDQLDTIGPDMSAGDLQYLIALAIKHMDPYNYQTMNDVMGALAGAQMEFYRQRVAPYEDTKIKDNGHV
jgi:hypothetical protein